MPSAVMGTSATAVHSPTLNSRLRCRVFLKLRYGYFAQELTFYRAETPGQIIIPLDDPTLASSQTILYKVELRGSRVQWVTRTKYE
eukprot:SAG31_NODE_41814_length_274_cov_0.868571_1_plen_85_part_10